MSCICLKTKKASRIMTADLKLFCITQYIQPNVFVHHV